MNIFPEKHVRLSESLLGLGSFVLERLEIGPRTLETIWAEYKKARDNNLFPAYHSFENFILATDLLFALGAIDLDNTGKLHK